MEPLRQVITYEALAPKTYAQARQASGFFSAGFGPHDPGPTCANWAGTCFKAIYQRFCHALVAGSHHSESARPNRSSSSTSSLATLTARHPY